MKRQGFPVRALGVRWWVDTAEIDEATHAELARLWSRAHPGPNAATNAEDEDEDEETFAVVPVGEHPTGGYGYSLEQDPERIPYGLSRALTGATLRRIAGQGLLFHSAGIVSPDGARAILLIAPSGTGKSTASHHLARTYGYLSDESIRVLDDLHIEGYAKPVSLIEDPDVPGHKVELSPDEAGYARSAGRPALRAVVILDRQAQREEPPTLVAEGLVAGLIAVLPQSSSTYLLTDPLDRLARALTVGGGPYVLEYKEIADCDDLIAGLFDGTDLEPATWTHLPPGRRRRARLPGQRRGRLPHIWDAETLGAEERVRRGVWTDAVDDGEDLLVLIGDQPYRLAGVGRSIWHALRRARTQEQLRRAVVQDLGDHPDAAALTTQALGKLSAQGLIERALPPRSA